MIIIGEVRELVEQNLAGIKLKSNNKMSISNMRGGEGRGSSEFVS